MNLPGILAKLLTHQAELADMLANHRELDTGRRVKLLGAIAQNLAEFRAFVAQYKISVEKRPDAPLPAGACPHCLR